MKEYFVSRNGLLLLLVATYALLPYVNSSFNKRGIAWPLENRHDSPNLFARGKIKWFYNWSSDKRSTNNLEFVSMFWSIKNEHPQQFVKKVLAQDAKVILGFNEPERGEQANMNPIEAARIWKRYIEPLRRQGIRLGSPSVASTEAGVKWLKEFLNQGCKIDFLALHWYGQGVDNFIKYITETRQQIGSNYPVLVTEFACTSWKSNQPVSQNEINEFFQQSINRLDRIDWIERYAWFGAMRYLSPDLGIGNRLINDNGQLSDLGKKYVYG